MTEPGGTYDEGHREGVEVGKVLETLKRHERHFDVINGSQQEAVRRLTNIELIVQRAFDLAESRAQALAKELANRDAMVEQVRAALAEAAQTRQNTSAQRWTPIQRTMAVGAFLITVAGVVLTIIATR